MKTIYVIDACALIDAAKEYNMSKKTFSPIWEAFDESISTGQLITSIEIQDELKDDDLIAWSKKHREFFVPLTKEIQEQVLEVLKRYPTLIKMKSTSNSNGDPFLIATAIANNGCIITNERPGDEKSGDYHIPNVCKGFDIPYMNLHAFIGQIVS